MKVLDGYRIQGLRLHYKNEKDLVEIEWDKQDGEWVTQDVPDGQDIIGLKCSARKHTVVQRVGFILWQTKKRQE